MKDRFAHRQSEVDRALSHHKAIEDALAALPAKPQPGDLYGYAALDDALVSVLVLAATPQGLHLVPADDTPLCGPQDLWVPPGPLCGPVALRCGLAFHAECSVLTGQTRIGRLPDGVLSQARALVAGGAVAGAGTPDIEAAPDYIEWIDRVRQAVMTPLPVVLRAPEPEAQFAAAAWWRTPLERLDVALAQLRDLVVPPTPAPLAAGAVAGLAETLSAFVLPVTLAKAALRAVTAPDVPEDVVVDERSREFTLPLGDVRVRILLAFAPDGLRVIAEATDSDARPVTGVSLRLDVIDDQDQATLLCERDTAAHGTLAAGPFDVAHAPGIRLRVARNGLEQTIRF